MDHPHDAHDSMSSPRLEELTRRLLEVLGRITGLESTYLTAIDWESGIQEIRYARNVGQLDIAEGLRVDWEDTLCRRAVEGGPGCVADVASTYPDADVALQLGITTYVTFPVIGEADTIVGTLCGVSSRAGEIPDDVLAVMECLARMISLHLESERTRRQLEEANAVLAGLALTDPLTGVGNRRALDEHLGRACAQAARHGVPVGVLAFDVDRFKSINDTYGHGAGDDVLRAVATQLESHTRPADIVTRPGGDEFCVVLLGADVAIARSIAERVRGDLGASPVDTRDGPVPVSVSIGVSSGRNERPEELLRAADAALYRAKASGRDAVVTEPVD